MYFYHIAKNSGRRMATPIVILSAVCFVEMNKYMFVYPLLKFHGVGWMGWSVSFHKGMLWLDAMRDQRLH